MKIEARMDEFEKVADKKPLEDVEKRMTDFEQVDKISGNAFEDKEGTLPFGLKRYRTCPFCEEIMEIHKIEGDEAVYRCKECEKETLLKIK